MFFSKVKKTERLGEKGEKEACRWLKKQGYRILERNYRCKVGEIDIIARDEDILSFVEVKTRSSTQFGSPFEAVDLRKQKQISRVALDYLASHRVDAVAIRFDVIAVSRGQIGFQCKLIKNAFEAVE